MRGPGWRGSRVASAPHAAEGRSESRLPGAGRRERALVPPPVPAAGPPGLLSLRAAGPGRAGRAGPSRAGVPPRGTGSSPGCAVRERSRRAAAGSAHTAAPPPPQVTGRWLRGSERGELREPPPGSGGRGLCGSPRGAGLFVGGGFSGEGVRSPSAQGRRFEAGAEAALARSPLPLLITHRGLTREKNHKWLFGWKP